ncbi:MAG: hypothetical protein VW862_01720, partial [Euryarchaeota archaeon]
NIIDIILSEDNQQSMLSSYDVENQTYAIISGFEMPNVSQQIYGLKFISSTSNSALIEWSTTKAGSGELRCNEVGGQNDIAVIPWQSESLTNTMTITNLSTAKNYQCFVSVGNITSEMLEFTTSSEIDTTPPDLLNLNAEVLEDARVRITWYTSESSTEQVFLNGDQVYTDEFATKKNHEYITVVLGLGNWNVEVRSSDSSGNENSSSITFTVDIKGDNAKMPSNNNEIEDEDSTSSTSDSIVIQIGILVIILVLLISLIRVKKSEDFEDEWSD